MPDAARWLLALLLLAHAPLATAASVDIEVRERGGAAVAGLPVRLLGLVPGGKPLARDGETNARGHAVFADLPVPAAYLVMVEHRGVSFHGEGVRFTDDDPPDAVRGQTIEVHEPSDDTSTIQLSEIRMFLRQEAGVYSLDQLVQIENTGDRVVLPPADGPPPVRIALMPGHGELRTLSGQPPSGFEHNDGFLALRGPVFPGQRELMFSYDLPGKDATVSSELLFPEETPSFELYIADQRVSIDTGPLHPARPSRDDDGIVYQRFLGFDLPAGTRVPLEVRPLPPVAGYTPLATALAAALLGAGLLFFVGQPVTHAARASKPLVEDPAALEKQALFAALQDLEHDFETGKLSAEDRDRLRAELRADALRALARTHSSGPAPAAALPSCASCGHGAQAADRFCSRCGTEL